MLYNLNHQSFLKEGFGMANLKSVFYASVGLALKGKEKVKKAAQEFVKDNKIEIVEGKKFIDKAVKYAEETKEELSKKISQTVKTTVSKMGIVTRKEIVDIKNEIKNLKTQVAKDINQKVKKSQKK
jgi:polyhydroxyalkanoate synthesis regulator phasin